VGRGRAIGYLAALATVAIAAVGAVGCGGGPTLTAPDFVERVNEQGVAVHLGHELPSGSGADAIYEIELPPLPGEPVQAQGDEHGGGGGASGSLYLQRHGRCR
jgi:hypothetical protein